MIARKVQLRKSLNKKLEIQSNTIDLADSVNIKNANEEPHTGNVNKSCKILLGKKKIEKNVKLSKFPSKECSAEDNIESHSEITNKHNESDSSNIGRTRLRRNLQRNENSSKIAKYQAKLIIFQLWKQ